MNEKMPVENCNHQWKQTGYWDGKDENREKVSGPLTKCANCDGTNRFTWEEWRSLSERVRTELRPS